jgi:4a-hydroxytetrahydrobiopterin dehydratase
MSNVVRLSDADVRSRIGSLSGWEFRDDGLLRQFEFADFTEAFTFMTAVAFVAERMGHHPEWNNVYDKVAIRLSTHDAGGVSENDVAMAKEISALFAKLT